MPEKVIAALGLAPHPEGGAFAETYRHLDEVPHHGGRSLATAIYFLLRAGQVSAWHRVASDELWFFHGGDPLMLKQVTPEGTASSGLLGMDFERQARPQLRVPAEHWQAAVPVSDGVHGWTLVGCVVAPGFDFKDFEMVDEDAMGALFPELGEFIALRQA